MQKLKIKVNSYFKKVNLKKRIESIGLHFFAKMKKRYYGSGIKRPYINARNRLMLGSGRRRRRRLNKKQKGGFLPLLTSLVPIGIDLISKVLAK